MKFIRPSCASARRREKLPDERQAPGRVAGDKKNRPAEPGGKNFFFRVQLLHGFNSKDLDVDFSGLDYRFGFFRIRIGLLRWIWTGNFVGFGRLVLPDLDYSLFFKGLERVS
jgi:hypothetical protein